MTSAGNNFDYFPGNQLTTFRAFQHGAPRKCGALGRGCVDLCINLALHLTPSHISQDVPDLHCAVLHSGKTCPGMRNVVPNVLPSTTPTKNYHNFFTFTKLHLVWSIEVAYKLSLYCANCACNSKNFQRVIPQMHLPRAPGVWPRPHSGLRRGKSANPIWTGHNSLCGSLDQPSKSCWTELAIFNYAS